ncbi:BTAD domain-containing putative transcriptional regulator [Kitasatospora sp. NPDC002040]|uniref:BTAD domain-containing putative transcriptional regulator n=1 Tax=Kitasatospora sp. NPDC002040 TaxID=3154661 RepID=UPI00332464E8
MRFGVLGPPAVWTADGSEVRVPEAKVRLLLAQLLVRPGQPVPAHRLVDELWGDELPEHPANALQGKVSHLRRTLERAEPGARALVVSGPAGYRLAVEPAAVDSGRFTALAEAARSAGPADRIRLLTEALALWRGPAFADHAERPFALAAVTGLAEARLSAQEELAEARLESGEHRPLLPELAELVGRHPLRQRLRSVQLRALYRSGRQAEALASYADLRHRLADGLGLDPEAGLTALHEAILRRDPSLDPRTSGNLPAPLSGLIGREALSDHLRTLLRTGRLVTLTGPGGVGKTRLALASAHAEADRLPDGAWLVELAPLAPGSGPAAVAEAILAALGVRDLSPAAADPADRLAEVLRGRELLLLLDNCEHLLAGVAAVLGPLLATAPRLLVLATSQELIGLGGELPLPVPPLEAPTGDGLAEVGRSGAARLFLLRAGAGLAEENAAAVALLCRRLDGIPLALELAAARARTLGVHGLAARLDDRFALLAGGPRDAPARQRTLRAVIDWSWQLLTEAERAVLRRLAVTADGCPPPAAAVICADGDLPAAQVPELLARLVERSLVVLTDRPDGPRFGLLESVRAYALEQLDRTGEAAATRQRHSHHFTGLALRAAPLLCGPEQREWLERLDTESANLARAVEYTVAAGRAEPALRLVDALAWYWLLRGRHGEARRALSGALALGEHPGAAVWLAGFELLDGGPDRLRSALAGFPADTDPAGYAKAAWFLSWIQLGSGGVADGERLTAEALERFTELDHRWGIAAALSVRARHAMARGDLVALRADGERSSLIFRELGDQWGQLQNVFPLAALAEISGDYPAAARLHRDGLAIAERLGLPIEQAKRLTGLGRIALLTGDLAEARSLHERSRRLSAEQGYRPGELDAGIGLALGDRRAGDLTAAESRLHHLLDAYGGRTGYEPVTTLLLAELGFTAELRGDHPTALAHHLDGLTAARGLGDPRAIALALEGLAGAAALTQDCLRAAHLLGAAHAARSSVGAPLPPAERTDVDRITATLRTALGDHAFNTAHSHGSTLTHTDLVP